MDKLNHMRWNTKNKLLITTLSLFAMLVLVGGKIYKYELNTPAPHPVALVEVTKAKLLPVSKTLTTYGTVSFSPENIQQITVQNDALIQQVFVIQGQRVKKDEPLLKIMPTLTANFNIKNAAINVDFAKKELDRVLQLRTQFLATNAEVQTAKQNLAKVQAELNNLRLKEDGQLLRAGFDGTVVTINAQPGQVVTPATSLLTIANQVDKQIRLGVEAEDLAIIQVGQQVVISPVHSSALSLRGYIRHITGQIDPTTGLIDAIVPLENAQALIAGSMVRGEIIIHPRTNQIVVPHSAILFRKNQPFVFINNQGKAEQRQVSLGEDLGEFAVIEQGVKINEEVISTGNYELHNGMSIRVEQP